MSEEKKNLNKKEMTEEELNKVSGGFFREDERNIWDVILHETPKLQQYGDCDWFCIVTERIGLKQGDVFDFKEVGCVTRHFVVDEVRKDLSEFGVIERCDIVCYGHGKGNGRGKNVPGDVVLDYNRISGKKY